jgi:transposase
MYPDWVLRHKKPGTNISKIGEKYYLYEVSSVWDKEKKRAKKITKGYLGRITPDGFIPKKEKTPALPAGNPTVKNYGGAAIFENIGKDILERLRLCFPEVAETIYTAAVLRLLHNHPFKRLEDAYEHSYLSEIYKGLNLSGKGMTELLRYIGDRREELVGFMQGFISGSEHLLFDGTAIISKSEKMGINHVGYNAHREYDPQVNLMYAFSSESKMPVYYRILSGNIRDVTAFDLCVKESGLKWVTVIADKGFASKDNFDMLEKTDLKFIVPLKRNSEAYQNTRFESGNKADFDGYFMFNSRPIWYYSQNGVYYYLDSDLKTSEEKDYIERIEKKLEGYTTDAFLARQFKFGTIALRSNLLMSASEIYCYYKERAQIEQTFDFLKNLLDQDKSYMQSHNSLEGWAFINHISLLLCYKLYNLLREKSLLSKFSVADFITHLKYIHKVKLRDSWFTSEISKKTASFFDSLGIHIT